MQYHLDEVKGEARQAWLKSILLKHGRRIFDRCAYFYAQLCALPRSTRRRLKAAAGASLTSLALALALSGAPTVQAATITVNGDGTGGTCSLADAITAAETNAAAGNCIAGDDAGGYDTIDLQTASSTIVNATITSNIVINGNGNTITANNVNRVLYVNTGDLTINNTIITGGNSGVANGGGIYNNSGTLTINDSTITGNYSGSYGGGIGYSNGTVIINDSTISNNISGGGGGGIGLNYGGGSTPGVLTVNTSTITGNTANGFAGGGIDSYGTLTINNSTISGNRAYYGGGVTNFYGPATINNSTITGNIAYGDVGYGGGGVTAFSTNMTLNRTIVSGNTGYNSLDSDLFNACGSTVTLDNYNVIGSSGDAFYTQSCGGAPTFGTAGASDVVPAGTIDTILTVTLADNGGPTFTHALVDGSPALDLVPTGQSGMVDQRGLGRDIDEDPLDGNTTNLGDAGAFEAQSPLAITLSRTRAETVDSTSGVAAVLSALILSAGTMWATLRRKG